MDNSEFEKYLQERFTQQVNWYDFKAGKNQFLYVTFQWGLIVLAALTPVLVALSSKFPESPWFYWIPTASSALVAILGSSLKTFRYQENWVNYRATCELLRKEYYLFQAGVDEYESAANKDSLFIDRIETIIARETNAWVVTQKKHSDGKKA